MGAFRKRVNTQFRFPIGEVPTVQVPVSKTVVTKDNPEPTVFLEMKIQRVEDYAKSCALPKDEDYQLRDMIASGNIPEAVPVSGMLDSNDPLDLSNAGVGDRIFDKLSGEVESRKPAAAPAAPAAPAVEPSNE